MANFIESLHHASKAKGTFHAAYGLGFLAIGAVCGYFKSKMQADIDSENYS